MPKSSIILVLFWLACLASARFIYLWIGEVGIFLVFPWLRCELMSPEGAKVCWEQSQH